MGFTNLRIEGYEHYKVNELGDVFNTLSEELHTNNGVVTHIILSHIDGISGKSFSIRSLVEMTFELEKAVG